MNRHPLAKRPIVWIAVIGLTGLLAGCNTLPRDARTRIKQANDYYAKGQYGYAKRQLNLVIRKYPKTSGVGEAYYIRGLCHIHQRSDNQARADFEKAMRTSSRPELLARINGQLGHLCYVRDDFRSAVRYYTEAISDVPDQLPMDEIYYRLGDSLQKIGRWEEARKTLSKIWYLFPKSPFGTYARRKFSWPHDYFTIQCGAFGRSQLASELANTLRKERFDASVEVDIRGDRVLHIVYVGSFPKYAEAKMALAQVHRTIPEAIIAP